MQIIEKENVNNERTQSVAEIWESKKTIRDVTRIKLAHEQCRGESAVAKTTV